MSAFPSPVVSIALFIPLTILSILPSPLKSARGIDTGSKYSNNEQFVREYIKCLKKIELTKVERQIVKEFLGNYTYNNGAIDPMEVIAEGLNKIVCATFSKSKFQIVSTPKEVIDTLPKELIKMLEKILLFQP